MCCGSASKQPSARRNQSQRPCRPPSSRAHEGRRRGVDVGGTEDPDRWRGATVNELRRMTWRDARNAFESVRLAIIPTGSCEQHGPHLSLATDIEIAEGFARRLAQDLGEVALLCPRLPY